MKLGVLIHSTFLWGEPETKDFIRQLESHKIPYEIVQWDRNNFEEYTWKNQPVDLLTSFGTISFAKNFHKNFKSDIPIYDFFDPELHYYSRYKQYLNRNNLLNSNGILLPFYEIKNRGFSDLFRYVETDNPLQNNKSIFFRPDNGLKICEAELVKENMFSDWLHRLEHNSGINNLSLFWLFGEKQIESEYRCLIANNKCVSVSQYVCNNEIKLSKSHNQSIIDFANHEALNIDIQDPIYIMDVCYSNNSLKVIELNCLATSGQYMLDKTLLVDSLLKASSNIFMNLYS